MQKKLISLFVIIFISTFSLQVHSELQTFSPKDFSRWLNAAYIAQATYESNDALTEQLAKQGYTVTKSQQIKGFSVSYVLASNDVTKQHVLAIRGTTNIENVMVDAAFVLVPDKLSGIDIHQGFLLSSRDIYQQVLPAIKPGYTINTIGHSLGGAVALIVAMMLDSHDYAIGEVVTFGQPKVTNISGSRKFSHLNIKRLVNPKDLVPLVPVIDPIDLMKLSIFWHQGTEVLLYEDNRYSVLTGIDSMLRAVDYLNDVPSEQHVSNHFMTTYVQHLKVKQLFPVEVSYKSDFSVLDLFN